MLLYNLFFTCLQDEFGFANLTGIKPYTNNGPKFFDVCGFMNGKTTFGGLQDCLFKTSWILATNLDRFPSIDSSEDLLEQCRENLCDSLEMLRNFASKYEQHFERFPIQNVIDIGFKNTQMYFLVVWYPLLNFPITRIKLENYFAYYSKMLQTDDARKLGVLIPEQLNSGYLDYKFKNSGSEVSEPSSPSSSSCSSLTLSSSPSISVSTSLFPYCDHSSIGKNTLKCLI